MKIEKLSTKEEITWCPGCSNNGILQASKEAIVGLVNKNKIKAKDVTIVTGVGCSPKIFDYVNVNGFYGLHGRVLPVCLGIKNGNPKLTVIGFAGDGGTYAEGIAHFIHACRYNANFTMIVHNNQVFSLTTGQATPTSEKGFVDGSTPLGIKEKPLNPIVLALESGASFVARGYALDVPHLKNLIKQAIAHKGFAFVDVLQPCLIFHNTTPYFQKNIYKLDKSHDISDLERALQKAKEWDYCFDKDTKIPIGIFYKKRKPTFEEQWPQLKKPWYNIKREIDWERIIEKFK
ncbi:2-oxoacid:ferredoxin oxidoreductase subunit beta [Patescibacteria group bacterium]|nr:2-oxoacid:ferredoxin oxidoreductase subunit beta [Patescibacteria group bacterium]